MAAETGLRRIDVGFQAGPVLSLRVDEQQYESLRGALGGSERWHQVDSEDATITLDLAQVIYVRLDTERDRVGFQATASRADIALLRAMRTHLHQPPVEAMLRNYSRLGEHGVLWLATCAAGAVLDPARRRAFARAGATVAGSFLANQSIKLVVRRPRPNLHDLPPLVKTMSNRSYPSAHATTCGAAAVALSPLLPAAAVWPATVAMALTRPYLGVHYPSDSVAGFALGAAVAELAA